MGHGTEFEMIVKYHSIPTLTKYIRSFSLLYAPDIDGWRMKNLLQLIFLSSDPDNEDLKVLVYDCLYIPWLKGDFLPEFAPEYTGYYIIALQKPSGGIRGIAPVDIWRRATGHVIVQATQYLASKRVSTLIQTSSSWPCQKTVLLTAFISLTRHTRTRFSLRQKTPRTLG